MALTQEQIHNLLTLEADRTRRTGVRKKASIDFTHPITRTYANWFPLANKLLDEDGELIKCENPNCSDQRSGKIMVAEVAGLKMCRICFLEGYGVTDPNQTTLS